jgi:flagellar basal body P-ring formation protein FlgA
MKQLSVLLGLALALAASSPAWGLALRPAASVADSLVRVGDLFADAGAASAAPVGPAPAVGMHITYGADWLAAIASEHKLAWTPSSPFDQITVTRSSRTIGSDEMVDRIMGEIAKRQPTANAELELDNPTLQLVVASDAPPAISVDGLTIEQRTGRFSAIVSSPDGDASAPRQRVTGRLIYRVDVPEPTHALAAGAVIAAADLDIVKIRRDRLDAGAATDPQQLIGKSPRRPLAAGQPILISDVAQPLLVHRGDLVTIVFRTDNLELTAQGSALEDGAEGVLVRIENTKSNRVIDAAVTGQDMVTVQSPGASVAQRTAER